MFGTTERIVRPEDSLARFVRDMGTDVVIIHEANGTYLNLKPAGCVTALRDQLRVLLDSADRHASQLLRMGWMLNQVRRFVPERGVWHAWLQRIDPGFHGKRVHEWMSVAAEFARDNGSPDPAKLNEHGIIIDGDGVNVSWTRLRTIVREKRRERRLADGIKHPGKADSVSRVLAGGLDDEVECDDDELFEGEAPAPVDDATRAARIAALKASIACTPRTDNETDMLPDPVGLNRNSTHVARVGEVPSAGDSGTHAPVQNPGVASDVGGSFRTSGPGEAETPMVQTTSVRGASGEQFTFEQHRERLRHEVRQLVSQIEDLLACAERGEVSMESAYAQICILRGEAVRVRRDAA